MKRMQTCPDLAASSNANRIILTSVPSRYSTLSLYNNVHESLVSFLLQATPSPLCVNAIVIQNPHVSIINNKMDNQYVENHLEKIIGIKLEHCEYLYHCIYNNHIIGTLEISLIHNTIELTCSPSFSWKVQECSLNDIDCSTDVSNPAELALLISNEIVKTM